MFFIRLGHDVNPALAVIYAQHRYAWSEQGVGFMLGAVGISSMVVQALLIGPAVKFLGERGALATGIVFGATSFIVYAFAPEGWMFIAGIPLGALFGLAGPAMQGLVTRQAGASEQGQLQGALASVTSIATMTAPLLFTQSFALGISTVAPEFPGLPYVIAALCLMAALVLGLRATRTAAAVP
jgi:DHA1 family tetracycline resistance protein-like MFS transporter